VDWKYLNPFWHEDQVIASPLGPDECRRRLKAAPASRTTIGRAWLARGDATFYIGNIRAGSILEMHVRVKVVPTGDSSSLHLRFSGGSGSAFLLLVIDVACVAAFAWALTSLLANGWQTLEGAGLFAVLIPPLLIFAMRSTADDDRDQLTKFVMAALESTSA
jgi:hypothetical protein